MHAINEIPPEIAERLRAQRGGRLHLTDRIAAGAAALLVIDMQNTFVAEGAPAEVPLARGIVPTVNRVADALRRAGGTVVWVRHENRPTGERGDWPNFFDRFFAPELRERTKAGFAPGSPMTRLWPALDRRDADLEVVKTRFSALIGDASPLNGILRERGIDTVIVAGTKTDVCCESTARDAMMLDYKVVLLADGCATTGDAEHQAALTAIAQRFGDAMRADDVLARLDKA